MARGRHRLAKRPNRALRAATAALAFVGALTGTPLTTAQPASAAPVTCSAPAPSATAFICAEHVFRTTVNLLGGASTAGVTVPVPGPVIVQTSLLDLVDQTVAQAVKQADDCVALTDPTCATILNNLVRDEHSLIDFADQMAAQAVEQAQNCAAQTDPTCALVIRTAQLQAQALETMVTTCVAGTNATCTQIEQLASGELAALVTLANQCVGGENPTCESVMQTAQQQAQALQALVTACASGTGSNVCGQLENDAKAEATAAVALAGDCASGQNPTCAQVAQTVQQQAQAVETMVTTCAAGTNSTCNQIEQVASGELAALATLANQCVAGQHPTCAQVVQTAQQQAQAVETLVTTCAAGTNSTCNQLVQIASGELAAVTTCAAGTNPTCNEVELLFSDELAALVTLANQCVAGQNPTCAQVVQTAQQQAQAVEALVTTCVSGASGSVCSQLEGTITATVNALTALANHCANGQDPTCNSLLGTVSQLVGEAITCATNPAPAVPNPLVATGGVAPDVTVTCQQIKNAAAQLTAGCESGSTAGCGDAVIAVQKSPCLNSSDQVACTEATAEPPAPVLPDADPQTAFPANVLGGSLQLGTGVGAANVSVAFYVEPANSLADATGDSAQVDKLGEASTDSNGNFSFTLPALDSYATSVANANNGYLNVLEVAAITAAIPNSSSTPSVDELAQADVPIKVGGSPDYWMSQPTVLTLQPVPAETTATDGILAATPPVPQTYDPTDPSVDPSVNYQPTNANTVTANGVPVSASQFNPWVVNGVDYRNAMPVDSAASVDGRPRDCDAGIFLDKYKVINTDDHTPVLVGESHAYWDAKASFQYGATADSGIQVGFGFDGVHWGVGGSQDVDNSTGGANISPEYGPYWGHQFTEQFHFTDTEFWYHCESYETGTHHWTEYQVAPTACKFHLSYGKDVSRYDGGANYDNSNPAYRDTIDNGFTDKLVKGKGYHYSAAFNAFGASFGATSGHSTDVEQIITAQWGGDNHYLTHDIWGPNAYWPQAHHFYSF